MTCPTRLALEGSAAGERRPEVAAHLEHCAQCGRTVRDLVERRASYLARHPSGALLERLRSAEALAPPPVSEVRVLPRARPTLERWRRLGLGLGLASLGLAGSLALGLVLSPSRPPERGVRAKGDAGFEVAVRRAGAADDVLLGAGDPGPLRAGDVLSFWFAPPRRGHLFVLGVDSSGSAAILFPLDGDAAAPVAAPGWLPAAAELDGSPGREWILAVFTERRVAHHDVLREVGVPVSAAVLREACAPCQVFEVPIRKEGR